MGFIEKLPNIQSEKNEEELQSLHVLDSKQHPIAFFTKMKAQNRKTRSRGHFNPSL
jgi:hypothetical protein